MISGSVLSFNMPTLPLTLKTYDKYLITNNLTIMRKDGAAVFIRVL